MVVCVYGKHGGVSIVRGPTDPGLHHVGLPVELQEGRVLVQLGLPLGRCPLQLRHLAPQGGHLGTDVVNMMVVLGNTHAHTPTRLSRGFSGLCMDTNTYFLY